MYDLIGDIHGHATELVALLESMDYVRRDGVYRHAKRQAIFLGDFIDRGPRIRETLDIVRPMVKSGHALAVMGNHEWNALAFHTPNADRPGSWLRPREDKNIRQHAQTLLQLNDEELQYALTWFRTLPLWLELPGLRAVHACWDEGSRAVVEAELKRHGGLTDAFLHAGSRKDSPLSAAVEILLKGKEMTLPAGVTYTDKDGHERNASRVKWYASATTITDYLLGVDLNCSTTLDEISVQPTPYPAGDIPVFVGHYWLNHHPPQLWATNVACLDYSVAKGGYLCAYRWNGEQTLSAKNFAYVPWT